MKKIYSWIIFILLIILCYVKANAQCTSSGARNGGSFTNNLATGSVTWVAPSNTITTNSIPSVSSTLVDSGTIINTNYIYVQNFGFTIPSNALICGISVKAERKQQGADGTNSFVKDNEVFLIKNSSIAGTNHAYPWGWTNYYANIVHGGSSDTWGTSWTVADINSPNFGVAISAKLQSNCCDVSLSAQIDHVSITIFYTLPLPVEIINFKAIETDDRKVLITWNTASETNSDHFTVERSIDGINWNKVEKLQAAGNSNSVIEYSVIDPNPYVGNSYYRIKQTDINSDFSYSDPINIQTSTKAGIHINIDPISSYIEIDANVETLIHATILDPSGKVITNTSGTESISIPTNHMIAGIYFIIAETSTEKKVQKFFLN